MSYISLPNSFLIVENQSEEKSRYPIKIIEKNVCIVGMLLKLIGASIFGSFFVQSLLRERYGCSTLCQSIIIE